MTSLKSSNNEPVLLSESLQAKTPASGLNSTIDQHPVELSDQHSHSSAPEQALSSAGAARPAPDVSAPAPVAPAPVDAAVSVASAREAAERAEILKRIAAFRNLQIKLRQDREKYYDETMARARSLLSQPLKPRG